MVWTTGLYSNININDAVRLGGCITHCIPPSVRLSFFPFQVPLGVFKAFGRKGPTDLWVHIQKSIFGSGHFLYRN